jgi:hypothetical protein
MESLFVNRKELMLKHRHFSNLSSHVMALGLTQPLTEMSTRNLPRGKGGPKCKADNPTDICEPSRECVNLNILQLHFFFIIMISLIIVLTAW